MLLDRLRAGHPEDGAVGETAADAQHLLAERGDQNRHRLRTRHLEPEVHAVLLALELGGPSGEQLAQHAQILAHVAQRLRVRHPHQVFDHDLVREAEAEREATVRRRARGERLLGHRDRVTRIGRHHRGAELDLLRLAADERERRDRVETEDVGQPEAGEALRLEPLGLATMPSMDPSSPAVTPPITPMRMVFSQSLTLQVTERSSRRPPPRRRAARAGACGRRRRSDGAARAGRAAASARRRRAGRACPRRPQTSSVSARSR